MSEASKAHCDTSVSASAPANQEYWNDAQPAYPLGSSSTHLENSGNYVVEQVKEDSPALEAQLQTQAPTTHHHQQESTS